MKIELEVHGRAGAALLAEFLPQFYDALDKDRAEHRVRMNREWAEELALAAGDVEQEVVAAVAEGPGRAIPPQEEPKPKRGRKAAAEKEPVIGDDSPMRRHAVAEEPEPAIRATPEDRQPVAEVEQIEEAEVVASSAPPSLDDLKAAMAKVQEVRGMDWLVKNVQTLLGAPRASAVADEDRAAAIARLEEAARG